ncbi:hypothetical protein [Paractinoplanes brasiliensis]|uniref:Uncharacterized protein n=1 Tax=Paractinoplanes brasiliensis TaxID=52695 RepID=A0A4R6K2B5_9ACTN|nr:hypothetical protein [Actinoplanes brasiliensis]TDO41295.1 hypothetical protein C8E87_5025 [Actinoplanes brasiliensis]GID27422.1 hypothetical protein Abr02nite_24050 [Actinoplanes brasiliensis]
MNEHLTFHESFDSTRATADDNETHPNLTQGQIEAVVSLLLGRSLSVNNTYGFDSRTFLELADVVLSTRAQVLAATRRGAAVEELTAARPFVLHRFRQPTFLAACADQLNRTRERFGSGLFRLSAWSEINEDTRARNQLAEFLLHIDRGAVSTIPDWLVETHPALGPRLEALLRLNSFFALPGSDRDARVPRISEQGYVEHLLEVADDETRFHAIAAEHQCPVPLADTVLSSIRERVAEAGTAGVRRAWIHDVVGATERDDPALFAWQQLQEFQDTIYNAVMADSAFSQFDYMSSTPRTDARDELKHVNALAVGIIRDRIRRDQAVPESAQRAGDRMSGLLSAASVLPHVPRQSLSALFRAYWELQADEDRLPAWQASTRQLNEILNAPARNDNRLRTAWADHLRLLTEMLPDVVDADDEELCIATYDGNGFAQEVRLGQFSAAEIDRSFSSGEHLAKDFLRDLARSA